MSHKWGGLNLFCVIVCTIFAVYLFVDHLLGGMTIELAMVVLNWYWAVNYLKERDI